MPISFGKNNVPVHPGSSVVSHAHARLIDIRSAEAFQAGFIPGSYNVPDSACTIAARRSGLFLGREIYVIADDKDQLSHFLDVLNSKSSGDGFRGPDYERPDFQGWFGAESINEWRRIRAELGSIKALNARELEQVLAEDGIVMDVRDRDENRRPSHASALRFEIDDLPLSLEGLPVESALCITASTRALAVFTASLLWNFGFHQLSYFTGDYTP